MREYVTHGHKVVVESTAGEGSGFSDAEYVAAGARIAADAQTVFEDAEMIVKVKEPTPDEYRLLKPRQILFTYLHLAADEGSDENPDRKAHSGYCL